MVLGPAPPGALGNRSKPVSDCRNWINKYLSRNNTGGGSAPPQTSKPKRPRVDSWRTGLGTVQTRSRAALRH